MKSKKLSPLAVYLVCAAAIVLLLAADQYTKSLAVQYLKDQPSIELIPGVLELFYLENRGMAFGLLVCSSITFDSPCALFCFAHLRYHFNTLKRVFQALLFCCCSASAFRRSERHRFYSDTVFRHPPAF